MNIHVLNMPQGARVILAGALAFFFIALVTFGSIYLLARSKDASEAAVTFTEAEKLGILASLKASTTPGKVERRAVLGGLESGREPTEQEKMDILSALH